MEITNRRRFVRWLVNRQAKIKLAGAEVFTDCLVRDISFKGILLSLPLKLEVDTFTKITLNLADEFVIEAEVWIAWNKISNGANLYGFYFSKIRDEDKEKIYKFMSRYYRAEISRKIWGDSIIEAQPETEEVNSDNRIFERAKVKFPAVFIAQGAADREGTAQIQDVSAKGIGMTVDEEVLPGSSLELWLKIPDQAQPLYTRGQVVWQKAGENSQYRLGIKLEKADLFGLSRALRV